jgi:ABC-type transporter MlaC component
MNVTLKSLALFVGLISFQNNLFSEPNPHAFIDTQAQAMVSVIRDNQQLFADDPQLFKDKINC